jgi:aerobic-type carbon monoxide dehydrogenase small subunit (CoxS/CutS family)
LRKTRFNNNDRGLFCGIGVCFDCLVIVDGVSNQRACLIEAKPGMKVQRQVGSDA